MEKQIIKTDKAPAPVGPYNQAIAASGTMLFCSGQIAIDPSTGTILDGDVQTQTKQVMANLAAVLEAAGADWSNVVKTGVFLKNMNDFGAVNEIYASYFDEAEEAGQRGVNSFQVIKIDGKWLISSIIWDVEKNEQPIPGKYLHVSTQN